MSRITRGTSLVRKLVAAIPSIVARPQHLVQAMKGAHWATLEMLDRPWLRSMDFMTIIDVGANRGQFASAAHNVFPHAAIHSLEPLKDCYNDLVQRMEGVEGFVGRNVAAGAEESVAIIHRSEFTESSSLLPMEDLHREAFPWTQQVKPESINVLPLDSIFEGNSLTRPALLKLDVQGFELPALIGAEHLLQHMDAVLIEVSFESLYKGESRFNEIHALMVSAGFELRGMLDQLTHPADGRILQSDAFFLRSEPGNQ